MLFFLLSFTLFFPLGVFSFELVKWTSFLWIFSGFLLWHWRSFFDFRLSRRQALGAGALLIWVLGTGFFYGKELFLGGLAGPQDSLSMLLVMGLVFLFGLKSRKVEEGALRTWALASALLLSASLLVQAFLSFQPFDSRLHGVLGHPAWAAFYLALCLPFLPWWALILVFGAMCLTGTKLGILVAFAFLLKAVVERCKKPFVVGTLLVFLGAGAGAYAWLSGIFSLRSLETRLQLWQSVKAFLLANPWGTGFGSFMESFYTFASPSLWHSEALAELRYTHNFVLEFIFMAGYAGLAFVLALLMFLAFRYRSSLLRSPSGLALLLFFLFASFQPVCFWVGLFALLAWLCLEKNRFALSPSPVLPAFFGRIFLACAMLFLVGLTAYSMRMLWDAWRITYLEESAPLELLAFRYPAEVFFQREALRENLLQSAPLSPAFLVHLERDPLGFGPSGPLYRDLARFHQNAEGLDSWVLQRNIAVLMHENFMVLEFLESQNRPDLYALFASRLAEHIQKEIPKNLLSPEFHTIVHDWTKL